MTTKVDGDKIKFGVMIVLYGCICSYYGQPYIHKNTEALNIIVTVFSILAGFLIAVITLVGDPASLPKGSWRAARLASDLIYLRLEKHSVLFLAYLSTLLLIFVDVLLKGNGGILGLWLERIYLFGATSSLILSFRLPSSLMALHQERIEQEIDSRRKQAGISDDEKDS